MAACQCHKAHFSFPSVNPVGRIAVLLLVAAACAFAQGLLVPRPLPAALEDEWALTLEEARLQAEVLWVDGRTAEQYAEAHFPGAVHLEYGNLDAGLGDLLVEWDPGKTIIVYCDGDGCESSRAIASRLREDLQTESVYWLAGGWEVLREEAGTR